MGAAVHEERAHLPRLLTLGDCGRRHGAREPAAGGAAGSFRFQQAHTNQHRHRQVEAIAARDGEDLAKALLVREEDTLRHSLERDEEEAAGLSAGGFSSYFNVPDYQVGQSLSL